MAIAAKHGASFVVGVDLGGTNVRAATVDRDGKIVGQARNPSEARLGADRVVDAVARTVRQAIADGERQEDEIGAVGMAVPGHIDTRAGIIRWSPNFGEMKDGTFRMFVDVPFTGPVSDALGLAVGFGNDANVAALGEFRFGAGRHVQDMVMFTLGTGLGSGVVVDGRLVIGATGGAVEFGHVTIVAGGQQCGCGNFGCLEAYCGTHAIVTRALKFLENGRPSLLGDRVRTDRFALTPKQIDEAARAGDEAAIRVLEETGYYLGIGCANAVQTFNPEVIVLGGGVRKAYGLMEAAEVSMRRHAVYSLAHTCRLVQAELGEDAGVMGAAELAWRMVTEARDS
jgi:glucokinase